MKYCGKIKDTVGKMLSLISIMSSTKEIEVILYMYENIVMTIAGDDFIAKSISLRLGEEEHFMSFGVLNHIEEDKVKFQVLRYTSDDLKCRMFLPSIYNVTDLYKTTISKFETNLTSLYKSCDIKHKNIHHLEMLYIKDRPNTIRHLKTREHENMVESVAFKLMKSGITPFKNKDIDLMFKNKKQVIMEFKTITSENEFKQLSKAIHQLEYYEFKHFRNKKCDKIIVVNNMVNHLDLLEYCKYKSIKIYYYNSNTNVLIDLDSYQEVEFVLYKEKEEN